jgi:hypothetical protein
MHATYERKTGGPRAGTKGRTPIQINVNVEPIAKCVTSTLERTPPFRQPNFSGRKIAGNTYKQGEATGGVSSGSSSQIYTPCGGSS